MMDGRSVLRRLEITQNGIKCSLPSFSKSLVLHFTVVASKEDGALAELNKLSADAWRSLTVFAPPPTAIRATLSQGLDLITITFNRNIRTRKTKCDEMFAGDTYAMFGGNAKCFRRGLKKVVILLGNGASLRSSDGTFSSFNVINTKSDVFFAYREQYSFSVQSGVRVTPPRIKRILKVSLIGPSTVGDCDEFKIKAMVPGPETIQFTWTVEFADGVDQNNLTREEISDLSKIQNFLKLQIKNYVTISRDMIKQTTPQKYLAYRFLVTVRSPNMLASASSFEVQRISTKVPMMLILGGMSYFFMFQLILSIL